MDRRGGVVERIKGHSQNRCDKTQHYLHDEIEGEVLDHVGGIEGQGAAVEGVEHGVAGTVGRRGAAIRLAALAWGGGGGGELVVSIGGWVISAICIH